MFVLGIASLDQDSGVALLDEKSILGAIEEEKLNRSLGVGNVPSLAMARILEQHGIRPADITLAAVADLPQQARLRESGLGSKFSVNRKRRSSRDIRKSTSIPQLRQHLDRGVKLQQYEHHLSTPPVRSTPPTLIAP